MEEVKKVTWLVAARSKWESSSAPACLVAAPPARRSVHYNEYLLLQIKKIYKTNKYLTDTSTNEIN